MKKRILITLILAALMLCLLAACGGNKSGFITGEEAQKIALKDAGLSSSQVTDVHTHVGEYEGAPCYSIHITVDGKEYEYVIAATGEILSKDN